MLSSQSASFTTPDWTGTLGVKFHHARLNWHTRSEIFSKRPKLKEPAHEIMALFILHKLILQTPMRSHPVGLDVWFFVGPFVFFHTSCVRTAKALVRLRECAGSPEPGLVAYVISTIISWSGSNWNWVFSDILSLLLHIFTDCQFEILVSKFTCEINLSDFII